MGDAREPVDVRDGSAQARTLPGRSASAEGATRSRSVGRSKRGIRGGRYVAGGAGRTAQPRRGPLIPTTEAGRRRIKAARPYARKSGGDVRSRRTSPPLHCACRAATRTRGVLIPSSGFRAEPYRSRAVVRKVLGAKAPDNVVIQLRPVNWNLSLVIVAEAPVAHVLTAAVTVSDNVFLSVGRVLACSHP